MIMKLSGRTESAPLAQLDRASGYGPEGRGFESLRAYQVSLTNEMQAKIPYFCTGFLLCKVRLLRKAEIMRGYWKNLGA